MKYTSQSYSESILTDQRVAEKLLSYLPARDRKPYAKPGISVETLAEIVTAYARKTRAADEDGYDLEDGIEVKYSIYKRYDNGATKACIGNLNSKRGRNTDLCVIIATEEAEEIFFKFMRIPSRVWESKIKGNRTEFCFQSNKKTWYKNFVISEREYGLCR